MPTKNVDSLKMPAPILFHKNSYMSISIDSNDLKIVS